MKLIQVEKNIILQNNSRLNNKIPKKVLIVFSNEYLLILWRNY